MGSPCAEPPPGTWAMTGLVRSMAAARAAKAGAKAALRNRVFIAEPAPVWTARAPGVPPRWAALREFQGLQQPRPLMARLLVIRLVVIGRPRPDHRTR